jgi:hypothetical protein
MTSELDEEAGVQALRDAVAKLEMPRLREDSLDRIVARRARGERSAVQTGDEPVVVGKRATWILPSALTAVAALLIAAVIAQRDPAVQVDDFPDHAALAAVDSACASPPATTRDSSALRHLMISAFGVPAACGAEPPRDGPIAYNASQIRTGTFTYRTRSITDGVFTSVHAPSSITVSRTTWKGANAFIAVRQGPPNTGLHLDSLIVSANGPSALHFASWYLTQHPPGSIRAEFDSASITIAMSRLDTVATLPFHLIVGQLPYGFAGTFAVPALPLANGWHGEIEIAPPIHPRAYSFFQRPPETIRLRVIGRETIRVPAGSFDCWKLQVGSPEDRSFMWVSTMTHLVVRSVSVSRFDDTSFEDQHELQSAIFDVR